MNCTFDSNFLTVHWEGGLRPRVDIILKIYVSNIAEDRLEE